MLTDRNQLPPLQAIERPDFEVYFSEFKTSFINELRAINATQADAVEQVFEIEGELLTKISQHFSLYLLANIEAENEKARRLMPAHAKENDLEHVVSLHGLTRQTIDPGDPNAVPSIPGVFETDDQLLRRFWLAPHAPAAGSRLQYRHQILTLDERPVITLDKPNDYTVTIKHVYSSTGIVSQIRDGSGRRTAPGVVTLTVLSNTGDGAAAQPLLDSVTSFFEREDVRPETDSIVVQSATPLTYTMSVQIWLNAGPDTALIQAAVEKGLQDYADDQHVLEGKVLISYINHLCHDLGAQKVQVDLPVADIQAQYFEAPYCTAVTVIANIL